MSRKTPEPEPARDDRSRRDTDDTSVPNRYADVDAICNAHPEAFVRGPEHDNTRRALLINTIIPTLNADHPEDRNGWGYMTKTDQPQGDGTYKIPCDVLMWRRTNESVDCLTGSGAMWEVHDEPAPPEWVWTASEGAPPEPVPVPPDPTPDDASVPVWFAPGVAAYPVPVVAEIVGTIVPQPSTLAVLIDKTGRVVSVQGDGSLQWRNSVGPWEVAERWEALVYHGTGQPYVILTRPRPLT
jgi:hypothetical protein